MIKSQHYKVIDNSTALKHELLVPRQNAQDRISDLLWKTPSNSNK